MTQTAMNHNLGSRIRSARAQARLSRNKLAVALGVDPRTVARWEDNETVPSITRLIEIAGVLGCPPSYFVDGVAA